METPFGATWDRLSLEHLRRFFKSNPTESQIWDAKRNPAEKDSKGLKRPDALKALIWKAGSAFANERGGFLVLGVSDRKDGSYELTGVELPQRVKEPHDWVSSIVRMLDPPPSFDVRSFRIGGGFVIVVRFDEVPIKPCMTPNNGAYRRLGSQSVPADHVTTVRWAQSADQLRRRAEKSMKGRLQECAEHTQRSYWGTWITRPTFVVSAIVPGLPVRKDNLFDGIPQQLAVVERTLPVRASGERREYQGLEQHFAIAGSEIGSDEGWYLILNEDGVATAAYLHAWFRRARLSNEPEFEPRWPKRMTEMFVAAALRATEQAIVIGTGVELSEIRRELCTGIAMPSHGNEIRRRGNRNTLPIVMATRWKLPGTGTAFARDVLTELSRTSYRPFGGFPEERV